MKYSTTESNYFFLTIISIIEERKYKKYKNILNKNKHKHDTCTYIDYDTYDIYNTP